MIRFETTRFGSVELPEEKVISFPEGIFGFPGLKRYILIDYEDTPVKWLQAVDDPDVAFIVVPAQSLLPDYSLKVDQQIRELLKLEEEEDLVVLFIVRVEKERLIANLKGPLLFNVRLMRGMQYMVND